MRIQRASSKPWPMNAACSGTNLYASALINKCTATKCEKQEQQQQQQQEIAQSPEWRHSLMMLWFDGCGSMVVVVVASRCTACFDFR
jgi:hypothetical protein